MSLIGRIRFGSCEVRRLTRALEQTLRKQHLKRALQTSNDASKYTYWDSMQACLCFSSLIWFSRSIFTWNVMLSFFCEREGVFCIFRDAWKGQLHMRETVSRRGIGDPLYRTTQPKPWRAIMNLGTSASWDILCQLKVVVFRFERPKWDKTTSFLPHGMIPHGMT